MRVVAALVGLLVAMTSCGGSSSPGDPGSRSDGPPVCSAPMEAPAGFEVVGSFEDPYADHVGMRVSFRDAGGRELHVFAGIPGEFGEGLPLAGSIAVDGREGVLTGEGSVWVLSWDEGGVCGAKAVLGNGFDRKVFLDMLAEGGLLAPG